MAFNVGDKVTIYSANKNLWMCRFNGCVGTILSIRDSDSYYIKFFDGKKDWSVWISQRHLIKSVYEQF